MKKLFSSAIVATLAAAFTLAAGGGGAVAKDYIVTGIHPNNLIVIDAKARKVVQNCTIPGRGFPAGIVPSPDGKIAYVVTNRWESVAGIDMDTCEQVFRAEFSTPEVRAKNIWAMDVTKDGKQLYVHLNPVRLGLGEYEVLQPYVAVYNTGDGIGAEPVRTFEAPRQVALMPFSSDGAKLFLINGDVYTYDAKTGEQLEVQGLRNWDVPYSTPDVLGVWPQWEQTQVHTDLWFAVPDDDPTGCHTGIWTLDLKTGKLKIYDKFEDCAVIIFSGVVNPVRPSEAYLVYTTLTKVDLKTDTLVKRIELDHTYYSANISSDGTELYIGGTMGDIAVYSSDTLEKLGNIALPGLGDMSIASVRLFQR